jgi:ERCC4-type nuclease
MTLGKIINPSDMQPGIIYIDSREPPQFCELITELVSIPVQICMLKTGDYCMKGIAIERKTVDDFCGSIVGKKNTKGRLFHQVERMEETFDKKYVFVTGTFEQCTSKLHPHAILGGLARVLVSNINVVFGLSNEENFVYLILKVFEKGNDMKILSIKKEGKKNGM